MSVSLIVLISVGTPGIILLFLGIIFYIKGKRTEKNCISMANRTVTRYTLWNSNGLRFPIVEYYVDGIKYKNRLKYKATIVSINRKLENPEVKGNILDKTLRVRYNSGIYRYNVLEDKFPIGSEMTVYYNPKNPKKSYVLRYPGTVLPLVFNLTAFGLTAIGVILAVIFWKVGI